LAASVERVLMRKVILVVLIFAALALLVDDTVASRQAYQRGRDDAVDSLAGLVVVYADGLTVALDELVKCELSKPGHIVFPSDTIVRPVQM
jgi:hypothetical protein